MTVLLTIAIYFGVLLLISRIAGSKGNDAFFRGNRQSPWPLVAFGMIGASLSGVTFVSVPGMVLSSSMSYMQMVFGFFFGYLVVAFVLLPIYYRHNLTSIYSYLGTRFGTRSRKTGAGFFILSKLTGAAARLYLVCTILQLYVFDSLGVPYAATVIGCLLLIWLYTRRGGIRSIVWTDSLQTFCLIAALLLILWKSMNMLNLDIAGAISTVANDTRSAILDFSNWMSPRHFAKQFLSGIFIVIVMTGLDQDMMQKNLTCKSLKDAQKDLCIYGAMFIPVNLLFLALGILVAHIYEAGGMTLPTSGDSLLPDIVIGGAMGQAVVIFFVIGIIASAFSSADSALTSLTTSFCIDILDIERPDGRFYGQRETIRKAVHVTMILFFTMFVLAFRAIGSTSVLDAIYTLASYTYGPLLGMFTFGMFSRRNASDVAMPYIAALSPIICLVANHFLVMFTDYRPGYEMLLLNGLITFAFIRYVRVNERVTTAAVKDE